MLAVVVGGGRGPGGAAVAALEATGADVRLTGLFRARADAERAITAGVDLVVHAAVPEAGPPAGQQPASLVAMSDDDFAAVFDGGARSALWALQAASAAMKNNGGGLVAVIVPTGAMVGEAGAGAAAASGEAQRLLARSAALQWRGDPVAVVTVAMSWLNPPDLRPAMALLAGPGAGILDGQCLVL